MKLTIVIFLALALVVIPVGCSSVARTPAETVIGGQLLEEQSTYPIYGRETMVVLYLLDGNYFQQAVRGDHDFLESGNKLYVDGKVAVNDLSKVGYAVYPDQKVNVPLEWNEDTGENEEVPITLEELNLIPMSAEYLPTSEHIAKLVGVNATQAKPATVTRKYWGETYDVKCLVTETIKRMWLDGDLEIGDYVLVSFIEEIPDTVERHIAIVTDKIFKSW